MAKRGTSQRSKETYRRSPQKHAHWGLRIVLAAAVLLGLALLIPNLASETNERRQQAALQPFYDTPGNLEGVSPGHVLRSQPMDIDVPAGGQAVRVLYRSEREDGTPTVSSGMVFFPAADSNTPNRPVVAWAHGTVGLGDDCAPSRSDDPLSDMDWLGQMLSRGWVVTATDYAGLGTAGTSRYLIGGDEARDVLNSVRAVRELDPRAGDRFSLFGHSQGGHSVLWAADGALAYAPELKLVGTAAAAPAAELAQLFAQQYQGSAGWVIGADVTEAWPTAYPNLDLSAAISARGLRDTHKIAAECVERSAEGGLLRNALGEHYFKTNPMSLPSWRQAASEQTPKSLKPNQPLLVVQSLTDQVVLPNTTALFIRKSCAAGSAAETLWLNGIAHQNTAIVAGPTIVDWLGDRFESKPAGSSCGQPLPIQPAG